MEARSNPLFLSVGTVALSRMMSMMGRPTNVGWYLDPGIWPVMTKNVPGRPRSFMSGSATRN